jgi:uncharacterized protein YkwD
MRRALALTIAATGWVAVIQLVTGSMAPPPEYAIEGLVLEFQTEFFDSTRADKSPTAFADPVAEPTTTTTAATVETTTTSSVTTTTAAPSTTVPTTTTRPKPATTTTAAPAPTTTAPPATTTAAPPATTTTAPAGNFSPGAESDFVSRINNLREQQGLPQLTVNASLNNYARDWSQEMATSGNFRHSNIASLLGPWGIVGENIGRGGSVGSIFDALVASTPHYNNMVDTRFTHLGVGVFIDSSGKLWTTHVFGG